MSRALTIDEAAGCEAFFFDQRLPKVPLPDDMLQLMEPRGDRAFATPDWAVNAPLRELTVGWLRDGSSERAAWCAVAAHGMHSSTVQLAFTSPRCGIFVNKLMSEASNDGVANRRRIDGTFRLMGRLLDMIEQAPLWPHDRRLAVIDDDTDTLCWGWPHDQGGLWVDLSIDRAAWIAAIVSVTSLMASAQR